MLKPPPYVTGETSAYEWNDEAIWRSAVQNLKSQDQISGLWSRSLLALSIGMAEWVFRRKLDDPEDLVFNRAVEALWASVVDRRYLKLRSEKCAARSRKHWKISKGAPGDQSLWQSYANLQDRKNGPKWVALVYLLMIADETNPDESGDLEAVYVSQLVGQVVGKSASSPFVKWRKAVMARFNAEQTFHSYWIHPDHTDNLLGPVLPPQSVDPAYDFSLENAGELVDAFLQSLDPNENPYLTPADELLKLGVQTPYRFA
ncbi:hypothetical protein CBA19CS11_30400 [Caballeronia novacaledonica]|uniref:hypothetical protein n=1 Tax=Caballeronia novacaledonica TaxID=1544861 RepID=UPI001EE282E1|nr:hypothetical protein [Caballeronia novacaledonica]GJH13240.1 hypothetical protein CBA19CS11_30400 [Caballeronia novacaledonica]